MDWLVKNTCIKQFNIFCPSFKGPSTRRTDTNLIYEIRFDADIDYESSLSNTSSKKYQELVSNVKPRVRFRILL